MLKSRVNGGRSSCGAMRLVWTLNSGASKWLVRLQSELGTRSYSYVDCGMHRNLVSFVADFSLM